MGVDELADDQARRAAAHGEVKARLAADVESEIADRAMAPGPNEPARVDLVATKLRQRAVSDVVGEERALGVQRISARVSQFLDYAFCVVYGLLVLRFGLALAAARSGAGFVRFIASVTDPLYAPFRGIVTTGDLGDGHLVVLSIVLALVVYLLAHLAVHQLLHVIARPRTTV